MAEASDAGSIEEITRRLAIWAESVSGGIALVRYDSEFARRAAVDRVAGELERRGMSSTVHDLGAIPVSERVEALSKALALAEPFSVVQSFGFANTPSSDVEARERLGPWNFARERLSIPNASQIWWMPSSLADAFARTAPDLYSWLLLRLNLTEVPDIDPNTRGNEPFRFGDEAMARTTAVRLEERFRRLPSEMRQGPEGLDSVLRISAVLDQAGLYAEATGLLARLVSEVGYSDIDTWIEMTNGASEVQRIDWLAFMGGYSVERGEHSIARDRWTKVLRMTQELKGDNSPDTVPALCSLAHITSLEGHYVEARAMFEVALGRARTAYGDQDPTVLAVMNNLATVALNQGDLETAYRLHARVLESRRRVLGDQHIDTAFSMGNLADELSRLGRLGEAEALSKEALAVARMTIGERHPEVLNMKNNYASILFNLGRVDEAAVLCEESLAGRRAILGNYHPDTLDGMSCYAECLLAQGKHQQALEILQESVHLSTEIQGSDHPATIEYVQALREGQSSINT